MLTNKQFHKFLIAGIINTIFFYTLYAFFIFLEFPYYFAIISANSIGIIFSFKNFGNSVFDSHDNRLLWKFVLAYLFLISFYTIMVYLFRTIGINDYAAGLLALIPHVPLSYIVNKKFVYTKRI